MKKAILTLVLLSGLFLSSAVFSSLNAFTASSGSVNCQFTEWIEYVLIGDQMYKITHHDDGSETIQAVGISE